MEVIVPRNMTTQTHHQVRTNGQGHTTNTTDPTPPKQPLSRCRVPTGKIALSKWHERMLGTVSQRHALHPALQNLPTSGRFLNPLNGSDGIIRKCERRQDLPHRKFLMMLGHGGPPHLLLPPTRISSRKGPSPLPPNGIHFHRHNCSLHPNTGSRSAST